jgi:hypothetical protein
MTNVVRGRRLTLARGSDIDPGQKGYGRVGVDWP